MTLLNAIDWTVSPEIISIGSHQIRWYGLFFALGLLVLGPLIVRKAWKREALPEEWFEKLWWIVMITTVVGARLGHCLFYDPVYYLSHPLEILKMWEGGLASHGGAIGIIIGVWIYSKKVTRRSILFTLDRLAIAVGLVAAMIRLGNLMNSEIFGRPTTLPWAFRFLRSPEYLALQTDLGVHPTAIYEALCYLLVFAICLWLYWKRDAARRRPGLIVGFFLVGVFLSRFIIESVKLVQEDWELQMIEMIGLNQGQLLSIPFVLVGAWLFVRALVKPAKEVPPLAYDLKKQGKSPFEIEQIQKEYQEKVAKKHATKREEPLTDAQKAIEKQNQK